MTSQPSDSHQPEPSGPQIDRRRFLKTASASVGLSATLGAQAMPFKEALSHARPYLEPISSERGPRKGLLEQPHHAPKAKRVIYLHMMGGPSQLDLFDYKPRLKEFAGKDLRKMASIYNNQRITGMTSGQSTLPLVPSMFEFQRYDNQHEGAWVSELLPHTARIVDKLCIVKSVHTEAINHEPGVTFMQTGSQIPGRPSMGAWISFGLGQNNPDLPAFLVLISQGFGNMQTLSTRLWGSGFLPSAHQGVRFRSGLNPVLFLSNPNGVNRDDRRRMLQASTRLNALTYERTGDPEVRTRIAQAEMAYRMQESIPELTDISDEDPKTLEMYGPDVHKKGSFAANCLLARRLAERDVPFVQLYHRGWDAHGNLPREIREQCRMTDQPQAALIQDLERRGLLQDTLVVWGGEFGRTAYCQGGYNEQSYGRDHHPRCFTMWFAGGGIQPGITWGSTDEFGYNIEEDSVHVHDLHATLLHLLGIDHERLTYFYQGRHYRLTDVHGHIIQGLLA